MTSVLTQSLSTRDIGAIPQLIADLTGAIVGQFDSVHHVSHDVTAYTTSVDRRSIVRPGKVSTMVQAFLVTVAVVGEGD